MKVCIGIVLLFLFKFSFAQTPQIIEERLLAQFKQISFWAYTQHAEDNENTYDSLLRYNDLFAADLLKYTSANPATIKYPFKKLADQGLMITDAEDGFFRIYSWNALTGGTMHNYSNVFQYKANNKVFAKVGSIDEDPGFFYSEINKLKVDGKTYYLAINHAVLSTRESYQTVKVFSIEKDKLNDKIKLIKTKSGLQNELGFDFDFFSVVDRPERPVKLIYYDKQKKTLKIPVVLENGKVTNKFITYTFTGKYFEKLKK